MKKDNNSNTFGKAVFNRLDSDLLVGMWDQVYNSTGTGLYASRPTGASLYANSPIPIAADVRSILINQLWSPFMAVHNWLVSREIPE